MKAGSRRLARQSAVQALYQWDLTGQNPDDIERHYIYMHDVENIDLAYFHRLVKNVPVYHQELDSHLESHLGRELASIDPVEKAILRLAVYELEFENDIPTKVILDEAIELSHQYGAENGFRFVNGVLDAVVLNVRSDQE